MRASLSTMPLLPTSAKRSPEPIKAGGRPLPSVYGLAGDIPASAIFYSQVILPAIARVDLAGPMDLV